MGFGFVGQIVFLSSSVYLDIIYEVLLQLCVVFQFLDLCVTRRMCVSVTLIQGRIELGAERDTISFPLTRSILLICTIIERDACMGEDT